MYAPKAELSKTDLARIELWTAEDMTFVVSRETGIRVIPRFTKCVKPKYTHEIKRYLMNMERTTMFRPEGNPPAVCVQLAGMLRYVWRTDVLTESEYDAVRETEKASLRVLRKKLPRAVGEGSVHGQCDSGTVATSVCGSRG